MSDTPDPTHPPGVHRLSREQYQQVCEAAHAESLDELTSFCDAMVALFHTPTVDVGPVLQGWIAGVLEYAIRAGVPSELLQAKTHGLIETLVPQIALAVAAEQMGATEEGHA